MSRRITFREALELKASDIISSNDQCIGFRDGRFLLIIPFVDGFWGSEVTPPELEGYAEFYLCDDAGDARIRIQSISNEQEGVPMITLAVPPHERSGLVGSIEPFGYRVGPDMVQCNTDLILGIPPIGHPDHKITIGDEVVYSHDPETGANNHVRRFHLG